MIMEHNPYAKSLTWYRARSLMADILLCSTNINIQRDRFGDYHIYLGLWQQGLDGVYQTISWVEVKPDTLGRVTPYTALKNNWVVIEGDTIVYDRKYDDDCKDSTYGIVKYRNDKGFFIDWDCRSLNEDIEFWCRTDAPGTFGRSSIINDNVKNIRCKEGETIYYCTEDRHEKCENKD